MTSEQEKPAVMRLIPLGDGTGRSRLIVNISSDRLYGAGDAPHLMVMVDNLVKALRTLQVE